MTTTDPRAWLVEAQERAENAVSIRDQSGVPIVTGYRVPDLATLIRTEHPAMAAALTAVLDALDDDSWDVDDEHLGTIRMVPVDELRAAITDNITTCSCHQATP